MPDAEQSELQRQIRFAIADAVDLLADPGFRATLIFEIEMALMERYING